MEINISIYFYGYAHQQKIWIENDIRVHSEGGRFPVLSSR